jgi:RNA polymerase sigma-70 factor (ECF subfamily)
VLEAGRPEGDARAALEALCRAYWYPLHAYLRRRGCDPEEARDLTQGFFLHAMDADLIQRARREKGRFRSYLLTSLQHFLASERRREHRQKRGGGAVTVSIDAMKAEERLAAEPSDTRTPEALFERSWAFALIERVFARLAADYERMGRAEVFARLRPYLAGKDGQAGYESVGAALGMNANAVGVAIHRMRQRYGELLRDEIAQTVASPGEVEEELAHLLRVVAGP